MASVSALPFDHERSERAIRHEYNAMTGEWKKNVVQISMDEDPFAEGSMRLAHRLQILGPENQPLQFVAKFLKENIEGTKQDYFADVEMQMVAKYWTQQFNTQKPPKDIDFIMAYVLELVDRPGRPMCCAEQYVEGLYEKFNNNVGGVSEVERNTPQAFSHYTFEASRHQVLVCDIQGVGDLYTDPQIHSQSGKGFGRGNLGMTGIRAFLLRHRCNAVCSFLGLPPINPKSMDLGTVPRPGTGNYQQAQAARAQQAEQQQRQYGSMGSMNSGPDSGQDSDSPPKHQQPGAGSFGVGGSSPQWNHRRLAQKETGRPPVNHPDKPPRPPIGPHAHQMHAQQQQQQQQQQQSAPPHSVSPTPGSVPQPGSQGVVINAKDAQRLFYSGSYDKTIKAWNPTNFQLVTTLAGHKDWVNSMKICDNTLLSCSNDATVKMWSRREVKLSRTLSFGDDPILCLEERDNRLFSGTAANNISVWDLNSMRCVSNLQGHTGRVMCLSIPQPGKLISGSYDESVKVWDVTDGRCLHTLDGHTDHINTISVAPDGRRFFSGAGDDTIRVWDIETGQCLSVLQSESLWVNWLTVVGDRLLISGSGDGSIKIWDLSTLQVVSKVSGHHGPVYCMEVAGNDKHLYTGSLDKTVKIWDLGNLDCALADLRGHEEPVKCLAVPR